MVRICITLPGVFPRLAAISATATSHSCSAATIPVSHMSDAAGARCQVLAGRVPPPVAQKSASRGVVLVNQRLASHRLRIVAEQPAHGLPVATTIVGDALNAHLAAAL